MANKRSKKSKELTKSFILWLSASYGCTFLCLPPPAGESFVAWYVFLLFPCASFSIILAAAGNREIRSPEIDVESTDSSIDLMANSYGNIPTKLTLGLGIDEIN